MEFEIDQGERNRLNVNVLLKFIKRKKQILKFNIYLYRNKNKMYRVFFVDNTVLVIILLLLGFICASIVTDTVVSILKYIKLY